MRWNNAQSGKGMSKIFWCGSEEFVHINLAGLLAWSRHSMCYAITMHVAAFARLLSSTHSDSQGPWLIRLGNDESKNRTCARRKSPMQARHSTLESVSTCPAEWATALNTSDGDETNIFTSIAMFVTMIQIWVVCCQKWLYSATLSNLLGETLHNKHITPRATGSSDKSPRAQTSGHESCRGTNHVQHYSTLQCS